VKPPTIQWNLWNINERISRYKIFGNSELTSVFYSPLPCEKQPPNVDKSSKFHTGGEMFGLKTEPGKILLFKEILL
jgi:hypothetical protein